MSSEWLEKLGGDPGANGFSTITAAYVQPAVGATVVITVDDTAWVPEGIATFAAVGGACTVVSVNSATSVTIRNSGGTSNAAPDAIVPSGGRFAAAGLPGATGASGSIAAVDFLATSNVASRSGTQTQDGVSTANKRGLLQGQTNPAENGTYFCPASGAWVSDFTVDADVAAAIGKPVFVKPGGTTVPAEGFNFQLVSGSTIAAGKNYQQIKTAGTRPPVRGIQTAAFPGSYSANTWTATATGALSTTIFDGLTIAIGEDVEIGQGTSAVAGTAHIGNGIYRRVADTSSKPTFVRRSDLDSAADFVGGAAYDVLDGASTQSNKGTRRQLLTQSAVVLGTTALEFGAVRERDLKEIDVTKWPYNVQFAPDITGVLSCAEASPVDQAIYDASLTGRCVRLADGFFKKNAPILMRGNCSLKTAGPGRTWSYANGQQGSWGMIMVGGVAPMTYGPTVDASAPNFSIPMHDAANSDVLLNLTHAGLRFRKWAKYSHRHIIRVKSLAFSGAIGSTRGRIAASDPLDILDQYYLNADGSYVSRLSIWSATSLLAAAAGAVPTITGGNIPDDTWFKIKITGAGARGDGTPGSGFKFLYSVNGGVSWIAELTSAASHALEGRMAGLTLNWTNASSALTDSWTNYEIKSLATAAGKLTAGTNNYLVTARWDPATNIYTLHVNVAGAAYDTSPVSTTFSLTNAVVNQRIFQECIFGIPTNAGPIEQGADEPSCADYYLGSIGYWDTLESVSGTSPTAMPTGTSTPRLYWIPQATAASWGAEQRAPGGNELWGWRVNMSDVGGSYVIFRRYNCAIFKKDFLIEGLGIYNDSNRRSGILIDGPAVNYKVRDVTVFGGERGFIQRGIGYQNDVQGLNVQCLTYDIAFTGCEVPLSGVNAGTGSGIGFIACQTGGRQVGTLWCNPSGAPFAGICLPNNNSLNFECVSIDDEGSAGFAYAAMQMSISEQNTLLVKGAVFAGNTRGTPFLIDAAVGYNGTFVPDFSASCHASAKEVFSIIDTGVQPFELGRAFPKSGLTPPLADRVGFVRPYGGKQTSQLTLTNADTTITATTPITTVTLPAGTLSATAKNFTLSDTNAKEGWEVRIACGVQSQNAVIKDGSAATVETLTAGYRGTAVYRHNGTRFVFFG